MLSFYFISYVHIVIGLAIKPYIGGIRSIFPNKGVCITPERKYSDNLRNVPVFIVESKYSTPISIKQKTVHIISAFLDPSDAINFLTEIAQTDPPGTNNDSGLRIRVKNLYEWLECVDPALPRIACKSKYKLVPNSIQLLKAYSYMPLSSNKDLFVPLFYSKKVAILSESQRSVTPLFLDFHDLVNHISLLKDPVSRELALKAIGVVSLVDILLDNPSLEGYKIVPSVSSLKFCQCERFSPNVKTNPIE